MIGVERTGKPLQRPPALVTTNLKEKGMTENTHTRIPSEGETVEIRATTSHLDAALEAYAALSITLDRLVYLMDLAEDLLDNERLGPVRHLKKKDVRPGIQALDGDLSALEVDAVTMLAARLAARDYMLLEETVMSPIASARVIAEVLMKSLKK